MPVTFLDQLRAIAAGKPVPRLPRESKKVEPEPAPRAPGSCRVCGGLTVFQQTRRSLDGELALAERPGRFRSGGSAPNTCMHGPWGYVCVRSWQPENRAPKPLSEHDEEVLEKRRKRLALIAARQRKRAK